MRAVLRRRGRVSGVGHGAGGAGGRVPGPEPCPAPGLPARRPASVRRRQGAALGLASPLLPLLLPV